MTRPIQLDNESYRYLDDRDYCYHFLEYTSGGGFKISKGNQQILNLKKRPSASENELYYKRMAIDFWGDLLSTELNLATATTNSTFMPMPCSKPIGHPDYDDRMLRVLRRMARKTPQLDIRELLIQDRARTSQHEGERLTPEQIASYMSVNQVALALPIKENLVVVDDVITMGASFKAAKILVERAGIKTQVVGLFLAKTIWPPSELDDWLSAL